MTIRGATENKMEHYTIYGKEACAFCDNAKAILTQRGKSFTYKKLDEDYHRDDLFEILADKFNVIPRTFPQVILTSDDKESYIGGFTELQGHLNK